MLAEQAAREHRSLAEQVVAVLARQLKVDADAKARRRALLQSLQTGPSPARGPSPVRVVLDASAAIEIVLQRREAARLGAIIEDADVVLASELFVAEFEQLGLAVCNPALEAALGLVDATVPSKELAGEAFLLARTTHRPAYHMFYLARKGAWAPRILEIKCPRAVLRAVT